LRKRCQFKARRALALTMRWPTASNAPTAVVVSGLELEGSGFVRAQVTTASAVPSRAVSSRS
jgi:hypothetical protein